MKRRQFILGAVAAAVAAALPASGAEYTYQTYAVATEGMDGQRMAAALARSMMQTREAVAANAFNRAFRDHARLQRRAVEDAIHEQNKVDKQNECPYSGEGARRSVGVEGSPDRI